ncbi:MAG: HAD family phosphatase [Melioribacteraceae bacterium]
MKDYKAYLFDMDGTLVDSEKLKGLAIAKTCNCFGGNIDYNIYKNVMGNSWEVVTNYFFEQANIKLDIKEFNIEFKDIYKKLLNDKLTLNPNAKEIVLKLSKMDKKIGIVTSANTWMSENILEQFEISNYFDVIITGEDVSEHKPHPQAYLLALEKLGLRGKDVLVFEDSNAGLVAAQKAKCDVVAFRHEFNEKNDLSLAKQIISDFNEYSI